MHWRVAGEVQGLVDEFGRSGIEGGHADQLTVFHLAAAIHVMVAVFGAHHHIGDMKVGGSPSGTAGRDDDAGLVVVDHLHSTDGSVHFADAAFLHHNWTNSLSMATMIPIVINSSDGFGMQKYELFFLQTFILCK